MKSSTLLTKARVVISFIVMSLIVMVAASVYPEKTSAASLPSSVLNNQRAGQIGSDTYPVELIYASTMAITDTYTIRGRVTLGNSGLADVSISDRAGHIATTDANGYYIFTGEPAGDYILTPSKSGYSFSPATLSITLFYNISGMNFSATLLTYSISGQVMAWGNGLAGVSISDGAGQTVTTNATGTYTLTNELPGSYTLTPQKSGFIFTPSSLKVNVPTNASQDFVAIPNLFIPLVANKFLNYFEGPWELEDNDNEAQANGPIRLGREYLGYQEDQKDMYYFVLDQPARIMVNLVNSSGKGVQMVLYYQHVGNKYAVPGQQDTTPPYILVYDAKPGLYFVYIYTETPAVAPSQYRFTVSYAP